MPTPQPVFLRLGFNAHSPRASTTSVALISQAAVNDGLAGQLSKVQRPLVPIQNVRGRTKENMPNNAAMPRTDTYTYVDRVDCELIEHQPATEFPMAQRHLFF